MRNWFRLLFSLLALLALLVLAACSGAPGCPHASFGGTLCTSGSGGSTGFGGGTGGTGGGGGGGGGGGNSATAYVVETFGSAIEEYSLDVSAGTLAPNPSFTTIGGLPLGNDAVVVAQGQYYYEAVDQAGQIYGWALGADGNFTAISGSPFTASYLVGNPINIRNEMITNPAGTLMFVPSQIPNEIYIYQIGSGGSLSPASNSPFALPNGFIPENMTTDGLGNYLYISNVISPGDASSQVAAYSIGTGGTLTAVSGSPFNFPMWQLQGDQTGQFLIGTTASVAGDTHLYVFSIAGLGSSAPGAISEVVGSPFKTTYTPTEVEVQPAGAGNLVYSISVSPNGGENALEGYQLNTSSGALTAINGSPFAFFSVDGQFDQTGTYFFSYDASQATLSVFDVTTSSTLTTPIATASSFLEPWSVIDTP